MNPNEIEEIKQKFQTDGVLDAFINIYNTFKTERSNLDDFLRDQYNELLHHKVVIILYQEETTTKTLGLVLLENGHIQQLDNTIRWEVMKIQEPSGSLGNGSSQDAKDADALAQLSADSMKDFLDEEPPKRT